MRGDHRKIGYGCELSFAYENEKWKAKINKLANLIKKEKMFFSSEDNIKTSFIPVWFLNVIPYKEQWNDGGIGPADESFWKFDA